MIAFWVLFDCFACLWNDVADSNVKQNECGVRFHPSVLGSSSVFSPGMAGNTGESTNVFDSIFNTITGHYTKLLSRKELDLVLSVQ